MVVRGVGAGDNTVGVAATASMRAGTAGEDRQGHEDGRGSEVCSRAASERVRGPDTKQCNCRTETRLLRLLRELVNPQH